MGMFILDEIHFPDKEPVFNVIGGAGTYAVIGGRMFSNRIGWIVDRGSDFPQQVTDTLNGWQVDTVWRVDNTRKTTRGWNLYGHNEERAFKYMTPKKRIEAADLVQLPRESPLYGSKSLHAICSPERLLEIVSTLKRKTAGTNLSHSLIVWEPVPDSCTAENYETCKSILQDGLVAVFSPNAKEAAMFLGNNVEPQSKEEIEAVTRHYRSIASPSVTVVIRAGAQGSVMSCALPCTCRPKICQGTINPVPACPTPTFDQPTLNWYPPYHYATAKVVDPTGAGNSFLGGFAVGLVQTGDTHTAAIYGTIASGAVVEQIGPPKLEYLGQARSDELGSAPHELWNGISTQDRLSHYKAVLLKSNRTH